MQQPENMADLNALTTKNIRYEGVGLETKTVVPCPFCAHPDWIELPILDPEGPMQRGSVCGQCHRGAKAIFQRTAQSVRFEIVQTSGPAQPDWMEPKMRRVGT